MRENRARVCVYTYVGRKQRGKTHLVISQAIMPKAGAVGAQRGALLFNANVSRSHGSARIAPSLPPRRREESHLPEIVNDRMAD